jgi:hypothetical protein
MTGPTGQRRINGKGYIYVITNPAWPGNCKVGRTYVVAERLRTYQTGSPRRDYALHHVREFDDVRDAERMLGKALAGYRTRGEWLTIHPDDAATIIDSL